MRTKLVVGNWKMNNTIREAAAAVDSFMKIVDAKADVISAQLEGALKGLDSVELYGLVVAYEPVWAIGTGNTCDGAEAERVCAFIRQWLTARLGKDEADTIRILYGGSVKASNARDL